MNASTPAPAAWRVLLAPGLAALLALTLIVGLGVWQLQRMSWKQELIAQIEARAFGAPAPLPPETAWPDWRASEDEFRRVEARGEFLPGKEVLLHGLMPAQRGSPVQGFYLFAPLGLESGAVVLVNRGFVPTELAQTVRRETPAGPVTVTGLLRAPEPRTLFVPANEPARDAWFFRDLVGMAEARGLQQVAPFSIDAEASPQAAAWPRGGQTRLTLPNNHFQYALTWFGIALTLVAVFLVFARARLRARAGDLLVGPAHRD